MAPIPPDIDELSAYAYEQGRPPLDWAIDTTGIQIEVWTHVCQARAEDPAAFPGFHPDLSIEALARRIIGRLLDAGWRIPGSELTGNGVANDGA